MIQRDEENVTGMLLSVCVFVEIGWIMIMQSATSACSRVRAMIAIERSKTNLELFGKV